MEFNATAIATFFPSFSATYDGTYMPTWADVLKKLEAPVTVPMTRETYDRLPNAGQLAVKFRNGCYECGPRPLAMHPKKGEAFPARSAGTPAPATYGMIAIDADGGKDDKGNKVGVAPDFDDKVHNLLAGVEYYMHSTVTSTENCKKRRIVIPLAEQVTPDLRDACIHYMAQKLGMKDIDPASANPKQCMVFRVHLQDGEIFAEHHEGKLLDLRDWLDHNAIGWQSVCNWPKFPEKKSDQQKKNRRYLEALGNYKAKKSVSEVDAEAWIPLPAKNKIHNAYNHTYTIETLLAHSEGRYVHTEGSKRWSHTYDESKDGIEVRNKGELICYYGSDPLSVGKSLDAFETYIILSGFGPLDDKETWKQAYRTAMLDEKVQKTLRDSVGVPIPDEASAWPLQYDFQTEEGIAQCCFNHYAHVRSNGKWWVYQTQGEKAGLFTEQTDKALIPYALEMLRICSALQPDNEPLGKMVGSNTSARHIVDIWCGLADLHAVDFDGYFERERDLLHFTDGVLDLVRYANGDDDYLLPHSPKYRMTQSTGYAFKEVLAMDEDEEKKKVKAEVESTIRLFLPNKETRKYFLMAVGRCLSKRASTEDKCIWLLGPGGGNGKTTIINGIAGALGDYYYHLKSAVLYKNKNDNNGEAPTPALAGMANRLFVNFEEFDRIRTLNTSKYKDYTSAGKVSARKMHTNYNDFTAKCVCVVDTNGLPGVDTMDGGFKRRTRVIPFLQQIKGDGQVKADWQDKREIHCAVMSVLLAGFEAWYQQGCKLDGAWLREDGVFDYADLPDEVMEYTKTWFEAFENVDDFFADYLVITNNANDYIIYRDLYSAYCEQCTGKAETDHAFKMSLRNWLLAHNLGQQAKKKVDGEIRRMCYIGVKQLYSDGDFNGGLLARGASYGYRGQKNA